MSSDSSSKSSSSGIGIGVVIAILLSWVTNHSVLWCVIHALLGWFYVIYWLFQYGGC